MRLVVDGGASPDCCFGGSGMGYQQRKKQQTKIGSMEATLVQELNELSVSERENVFDESSFH